MRLVRLQPIMAGSVPSRAVRAALGLPPRRPCLWASSILSQDCFASAFHASVSQARYPVKPSGDASVQSRSPARLGWAQRGDLTRARDADDLFTSFSRRDDPPPQASIQDTADRWDSGDRPSQRMVGGQARSKGKSMDKWISQRSAASRQDRWDNSPRPSQGRRESQGRLNESTWGDDKWGSARSGRRAGPRKGDADRSRSNNDKGLGANKKPAYLPPRKVDFGLPQPPDARKLLRDLRDHCRMVGDGKDSRRRVMAYGVQGEAVRQMSGARYDEEAAAALLERWKLEAFADIDEALKRIPQSSAGAEAGLKNRKGGLVDFEGAYQAQKGPDAERSLRRYAMQSFLDWIEAKLAAQGSQLDAASSLALIRQLRATVDLSTPSHLYAKARTITRHIHLHVGPTNSGKTHGALLALCKARTGVYAGPLRLLAHEVWERINEGTVSPGVAPRTCNLLTGEEVRVVDPLAGLQSCTVEMASMDQPVDVAVVDEIQMISDEQRGYAWTAAVLGLPAKEIHLCGEASAVPLIQRLAESCGDVLTIHEYKRLTPLVIEEESLDDDLSKIKKGDCVVAFSRNGIFGLKNRIEKVTGLKCAVAYGSLPPETKSEQARLFNDPDSDLDVMVASDAIGMGLNLKIKRIIFHSVTKWNGSENVYLSASQIKQIAGRAGRYGTGAEAGGTCTTLMPDDLPVLRAALAASIVPIEQAAIQPASEAIASLSSLLGEPNADSKGETENVETKNGVPMNIITPPQRSLSSLYMDVGHLAQVDSAAFFLSGFSQQHVLSPLVEEAGAGRLTLADRERFSNAPANVRDELVVKGLQSMVNAYARGKLVLFANAVAHLGILDPLWMVERHVSKARAEAEKESRWQARQQQQQQQQQRSQLQEDEPGEREGGVEERALDSEEVGQEPSEEDQDGHSSPTQPPPAPTPRGPLETDEALVEFLTDKAATELDVNVLMLLESLHRCLSLYLWLSFRFPLNFCFQNDVEDLKLRTEVAIPFVLEAIRAGRRARLQTLAARRDRILREQRVQDRARKAQMAEGI